MLFTLYSVRGILCLMSIKKSRGTSKLMEALNIVYSLVGGILTSLFTLMINAYFNRKKFLCSICEFVEELTLNKNSAYSTDIILIKLKNYDTQICSRFNRKIKNTYEILYGDIVQCLRLKSSITETAIFASYNAFLRSIKFYLHRRYDE